MYCPSCGSNNVAEVRYCTRCGTNLGVLTDTLTGKPNQLDERMMKLIKDYYKGRRDTITGAVLVPGGIFVMALLIWAGMPPMGAFFIICWIFFWAVASLAIGAGNWLAARDEMKALGHGLRQGPQPRAAEQRATAPTYTTGSMGEGHPTGPSGLPASVTEQTTRHLEDKAYQPPAEGRSKQTQ